MRNRTLYTVLVVVTILIGLSTRKFPHIFPKFVVDYGGDTLWALTAFFLLGLIFSKVAPWQIFVTTVVFSFAIELSQLVNFPLFDVIRANPLGRLIFGYGFLWSDLLCYVAGAGIGLLLEYFVFVPDK